MHILFFFFIQTWRKQSEICLFVEHKKCMNRKNLANYCHQVMSQIPENEYIRRLEQMLLEERRLRIQVEEERKQRIEQERQAEEERKLRMEQELFIQSFVQLQYPGSTFSSRTSENDIIDAGTKPFQHDALRLAREHRCAHLHKMISDAGAVLIRGPSFSGKTWMCFMFAKYLQALGNEVCALHLLDFVPNRHTVDSYFQQQTGMTFIDWRERSIQRPVYVLIDEAQIFYQLDNSQLFWTTIKSCIENGFGPYQIRFVLFSCYGSKPKMGGMATPVGFPDNYVLGIRFLQLTAYETQEIFKRYNEVVGSQLSIDARTQSQIYQICGGLVGFMRRTIYLLHQHLYKRLREDVPLEDQTCFNFLQSKDYHVGMSCVRFFPEMDYTPEERQFFQNILLHQSVHQDVMQSNTVQNCMKYGIVVFDSTQMQLTFPAPIVRQIMARRILRSAAYYTSSDVCSTTDLKSAGIVHFVIIALQYVHPSVLLHEYSRGKDNRPFERIWQMEFYRAASRILDSSHFIHVDFDDLKNSDHQKYLDFYVNHDMCWALEFLREGIDIPGHVQRFQPQGLYGSILHLIRDYLVLDFRSIHKQVTRDFGDSVVHVSYTSDMKQVRLTGHRIPSPITIALLGDVEHETHLNQTHREKFQ